MILSIAVPCLGQQAANLSFQYQGPNDPAPITVGPGGTIPFAQTSLGAKTSNSLLVTNKGVQNVIVSNASTNSPSFSVIPSNINVPGSGGLAAFTVSFSPLANGPLTAILTLTLSTGETVTFQLTGTGVAPNFITSYIINPDGNQTPVSSGGTISFPNTSVGQSTVAVFVISNTGTGAGTVGPTAAVSGSSFKITGLQLLPAQVNPGTDFRFNVVFTPTAQGLQTGTLQVDIQGTSRTFTLQGQGAGATFKYELINGSDVVSVLPNGTISFPDTGLNGNSSLNLRITNTGNSPGQVAAVTVSGASFQRTDKFPLPTTVPAGGVVILTLAFAPVDVGPQTGTLIIDSALFNLQGNGIGSRLSYVFRVGSTSTPLSNNGTASFPNTTVGSQSTASLDVTNTGNADGTISSLSSSGASFHPSFPSLPATVGAGKTLSIPIVFAPTAVGPVTGTLTADAFGITLRGVGAAPANIGTYTFSGLGSTVNPLSQPSVGLTLDNPYPFDVTGTLTLAFTPVSFADDPIIQFATGGRTITFKIPANTTTAIFGASATSVQFQSGTVAGTITFTPSFTLGGADVTPQPVQTKSVSVAAGAPQLVNAQLGTLTTGTFEIVMTGYATNREVSSVTMQFTPATGSNLETTTLNINVQSQFSAWYQSAQSVTVGSQFTCGITINVTGGTIDAVKSVAVTVVNSLGTSQTMNVNLH
ncbi:MAG TPA: choice-of-anchor D domain-containing protein [Bryobacteraceae bacterium]|nr:choice-of-anchor D domain-containing protein [Bryobacteraceae bacterium]